MLPNVFRQTPAPTVWCVYCTTNDNCPADSQAQLLSSAARLSVYVSASLLNATDTVAVLLLLLLLLTYIGYAHAREQRVRPVSVMTSCRDVGLQRTSSDRPCMTPQNVCQFELALELDSQLAPPGKCPPEQRMTKKIFTLFLKRAIKS